MKPLISKSLLVPILHTFLLLIFSLHLHTPTQAARMLLPFPGSRVASTPLSLPSSSSSSYQVDLLLHHLPPAARKLGETSSSTSTSLRRIPRSGPNPTQNRMKPKLRS